MNPNATMLYHQVVSWARQPYFYNDLMLRDHVLVRFELLAIHLALLLQRLKLDRSICQDLVDLFVLDIDACVRELPVSDLKVGQEVKRLVQAFYGRLLTLERILVGHESQELKAYCERNLFVHTPQTSQTTRNVLILYIFFFNQWLQQHQLSDFLRGVSPLVQFHGNDGLQQEAG